MQFYVFHQKKYKEIKDNGQVSNLNYSAQIKLQCSQILPLKRNHNNLSLRHRITETRGRRPQLGHSLLLPDMGVRPSKDCFVWPINRYYNLSTRLIFYAKISLSSNWKVFYYTEWKIYFGKFQGIYNYDCLLLPIKHFH